MPSTQMLERKRAKLAAIREELVDRALTAKRKASGTDESRARRHRERPRSKRSVSREVGSPAAVCLSCPAAGEHVVRRTRTGDDAER